MPDADRFRIVVVDGTTAADAAALARSAPAAPIDVVFEVEDLASAEIVAFVDLVDHWLLSGRSVRLNDAPQMLAHTLYKVGRLGDSQRLAVSVRGTEPYPS